MYSTLKTPLARLLVLAVIGFSAPALSAAEQPAPEDHSAEFKTLDADFARLDGLYNQYVDPLHKLTILGYIELLKRRANLLGWHVDPLEEGAGRGGRGRGGRGAPPPAAGGGGYDVVGQDEPKAGWDQVKYDELRYDINLQAQRLANYMAPLRTPPPTDNHGMVNVAKLNPSPANPAEIKAALDAVDYQIKRMETHAASLSVIRERNAAMEKINRIKERRLALGKEFTKARWDALVGDLQ